MDERIEPRVERELLPELFVGQLRGILPALDEDPVEPIEQAGNFGQRVF